MSKVKNEVINLTITDIGSDGEGIGKIDGFTYFVKDAIPGDEIEAKVVKAKKNFAFARVERIITPSKDRVEPKCVSHKQCGGCKIQAMNYTKQLEFKQNKIYNNLIRIGGLNEELVQNTMEDIVGMEEPFRYRNKAQYPFGVDRNNNIITGFYAERSHNIVPNTECYLGEAINKEILEVIIDYMKSNNLTAFNEETHTGLVRHVLIRSGFTSKEIMVCFVLNMEENDWNKNGKLVQKIKAEELIKKLTRIPGVASICANLNTRKDNVIMGNITKHIFGKETISDTIHVRNVKENFSFTGDSLEFEISPLSFYQVNPIQTEKLYSIALEYAGLTGEETVWDLYCGIGTISLFLARQAKKVYGVEVIEPAILNARENAIRNNIFNAEFFVGEAEVVLPEKYKNEGIYADIIVVDPPRKGCDKSAIETMLKMQPKRIVYVSCDSATLARDLAIFGEGGYTLEKWRGVDQFAHTGHVECVVLMSRVEK